MAKKRDRTSEFTAKGRDGSLWEFGYRSESGKQPSGAEFGELLRQAIEKSGVSQYHLAKASGVGQGIISHFLGGADLRLKTFTLLAQAMGLELHQNVAKAPKKTTPKAGSKRKT